MKNIAVYCASSSEVEKKYLDSAASFGRRMGKEGYNIVYGGYNKGIMNEVAYGTKVNGGKVYSVVPDIFDTDEMNAGYSDKIYHVPTMSARKATMEELADILVILPGGIGTFDEFFEAIVLKSLGELSKPIYVYNFEGFYDKLIEFLDDLHNKKFISDSNMNLFKVFTNEDEFFNDIKSL